MDTETFGEMEYRQQLVGRALELMQSEFQAHRPGGPALGGGCIGLGRRVDVAAELGISVDSVYAAKSRVLRRLRKELEGLLD